MVSKLESKPAPSYEELMAKTPYIKKTYMVFGWPVHLMTDVDPSKPTLSEKIEKIATALFVGGVFLAIACKFYRNNR